MGLPHQACSRNVYFPLSQEEFPVSFRSIIVYGWSHQLLCNILASSISVISIGFPLCQLMEPQMNVQCLEYSILGLKSLRRYIVASIKLTILSSCRSHPEETWVWGEPSEDPQRLTRGVLYTPGVET